MTINKHFPTKHGKNMHTQDQHACKHMCAHTQRIVHTYNANKEHTHRHPLEYTQLRRTWTTSMIPLSIASKIKTIDQVPVLVTTQHSAYLK